eukprot:403359595
MSKQSSSKNLDQLNTQTNRSEQSTDKKHALTSQNSINQNQNTYQPFDLPKQQKLKEQMINFDMNTLFTMNLSYQFDPLKALLEQIMSEFDVSNDRYAQAFEKLSQQIYSQDQRISGLQKNVDQRTQNLAKLCDESSKEVQSQSRHITDIEEKLNQVLSSVLSLQEQQKTLQPYDDSAILRLIESIEQNLQAHQMRLKTYDEKFTNMRTGAGNGGLGLEEMEAMLEDVKTDFKQRFVRVEEFAEFKSQNEEKLSEMNSKQFKLQEHSDNHEIRIKALEQNLEEETANLKSKLQQLNLETQAKFEEIDSKCKDLNMSLLSKTDCELFDEEINNIKSAITALSTTSGSDSKPIQQIIQTSGISSKDLNKLREVSTKVIDIEELVNKLLRDMKSLNINEFREQVQEMNKKIANKTTQEDLENMSIALKNEFNMELEKIKQQMLQFKQIDNQLEEHKISMRDINAKISMIDKQMSSMKLEIQEIRAIPRTQISHNDGDSNLKQSLIGSGEFDDILKRLVEVEDDFRKHKFDLQKALLNLQEQLQQKASIEQMNELEQRILEKLNELFQALMSKFADKNETKKTIKQIEQSLKNLYDVLSSQQAGNGANINHEDDAMFAKKPLGGWSCASCEKGLVNIQGHQADYNPWSRLPFKDPSERISKYGAGFSKMLSNMRPEQTIHLNSTSLLQNSSQNLMSSKGFLNDDPLLSTQHQTLEVSNSLNVNTIPGQRGSGSKTSHGILLKHSSQDTILPNLKKDSNNHIKINRQFKKQ